MTDVTRYPQTAWRALGRAVKARRVALRMSQDDLAEKAGVGVNTVSNIEKGSGPRRDLTLAAIEDALGWQPGSYLLVLDGGVPLILETVSEPEDDALRLERPEGISDGEWAAISEKLVADLQFWLRTRRN